MSAWARIRIDGLPWAAWAKFQGASLEQVSGIAMKTVANLRGYWGITAEYQVSDRTPMEE